MNKEVKYGAILSYILIFANSVYGLVFMPYILGHIGPSEYGVYKTIASMTASIAVVELGVGSTIQRFLAKYIAKNEMEKCYNFSAMGLIQAGFLAIVAGIVGVVLFPTINKVYSASFTPAELVRAKQIFVILVSYVMLHIMENSFFGIISGYNKFTFSNSLKLLMLILKLVSLYVLIPIIKNALIIVIINILIELITVLTEICYVKFKLKHKIKLYKWDNEVFKESFAYTILLFIQTLIIQFNGNIDNMVIGAVMGATSVAVYSFALQIFGAYEQCATAISGVVLPTVTNQIYSGATSKDLEKTIVKLGKVQWFVLGGALCGFICFGREFFSLWLGDGYSDCYYLSLILMIPVTFPLIVNVCLAILKAKNLLVFRTIAMAYSVVINAVMTIIGTHYFGYWAAAVGTAMSTIVGSVISLNIYYQIKLKINVFVLYIKIMYDTIIPLGISIFVGFYINGFFGGSWIMFILKAAIFGGVYVASALACKKIIEKITHRKES